MTQQILDKLPQNVRDEINRLRASHATAAENDSRYWIEKRDNVRFRVGGYVAGLRDAGLITDRERQLLFIYCTL